MSQSFSKGKYTKEALGSERWERRRASDKASKASLHKIRKAAGLCKDCGFPVVQGRLLCVLHLEKQSKRELALRKETVALVFSAYGNRCSCPGCKVTERAFLTLDHINNDGAAHRREVGGGHKMYRWARKNGFPKTLQLFCANCHLGKTRIGVCPLSGTKH